MKKSTEFIQERAAHIKAQKRLHDAAAKEQRTELNEAEAAEFRDLQGKIEALNEKIKDAEAYEANLRAIGAGGESQMRKPGGEYAELDGMAKRYSIHKAIRSQLPNGERLSGVELEVHQEMQKRAAEAGQTLSGVGIPTKFISEKRYAGQSVTQDGGAFGGNLVATEQQGVIEFLRPNPVVRQLGARYITGLKGNVEFPINQGGIEATWQGEVTTIDPTKNAYGMKGMTPKRLGATVPISLQNLIQSTPDLERLTMDEINAAFDIKLDATAFSGVGTGYVPMGILNAPDTNSNPTGANGGAPTWAQLVKTGVLVRNANAGSLAGAKFAWAINPLTTGTLESTQKVSGQAIMLLENGKIAGYPFAESTLLPSNLTKGTHVATDLSAAIFGDWNQFYIGQWDFVDVVVDNITKKKEGAIEITVNGFFDMMIRQPKAFTVIKDWVTV